MVHRREGKIRRFVFAFDGSKDVTRAMRENDPLSTLSPHSFRESRRIDTFGRQVHRVVSDFARAVILVTHTLRLAPSADYRDAPIAITFRDANPSESVRIEIN